jgi:hypothetical protein
MKALRSAFLLTLLCTHAAFGQRDTLSYDGIGSLWDAQLVAVTTFPGELQAVLTTRFSPRERCRIDGVQLGASVVRFTPAALPDTVVVWVYESAAVPPALPSLVRTYTYPIGTMGFPEGNYNVENPLGSPMRGVLTVPFSPPVVLAPARDVIIGVTLRSTQRYTVGEGRWSGLSMLVRTNSLEYRRYGRYMIAVDPLLSAHDLLAGGLNAAMYMRAVVEYDATLPDTPVTGVDQMPGAVVPAAVLAPVAPHPVRTEADLGFTLAAAGRVRLEVRDLVGRVVAVVAEGWYEAGTHRAHGDFRALPAGTYALRLVAAGGVQTRMVHLLR